MSKRRSERCFTYGGVIYFRFIILKCIVKKMLFCIKRSFVWLKKIVFDESFYEIVLLLIQFFSCTWLLLFLRAGRLCNVLSDLRLFFYSFDDFFSMIWWNTITVFFSVVFFCEIFCLVSLIRGRFFSCWFVKKVFVEWIGSFVEWDVGEFVFFSASNFSLWD